MRKPSFATIRNTGLLYANWDSRYEATFEFLMNSVDAAGFTRNTVLIAVVQPEFIADWT